MLLNFFLLGQLEGFTGCMWSQLVIAMHMRPESHEVSHDEEKALRPVFICVQAGSLQGNILFWNADLI